MARATDLERENLEAHVDLCSERYKGLHDRLSAIEFRLAKMNEDMTAGQKSTSKTLIVRVWSLTHNRSLTSAILLTMGIPRLSFGG